jgi:transposase
MARTMAGTVASTGAGTGAMERVEIVTRGEGRRSYSPEDKARLLAETTAPGATVLEVARRHGICASLLHRWRRVAEGRPVRKAAARRPAPGFVPVLLDAAAAARPGGGAPAPPAPPAPPAGSAMSGVADAEVEVVLRNGRVLRVGVATDAAAVARFAAALEA